MNKKSISKILDHPDREEIISKLVIGISSKDIHEWLAAKYTNISESQFVLSDKAIKLFQDNYLDMYNMIHQDLSKTKSAIAKGTEQDLELAIKSNLTYKNRMLELADKELDIKKIITNLCVNIEMRLGQIFDEIQSDPRNINTRVDKLVIEYADSLASVLEKYHKFTTVQPDMVIQHNVTLQTVDQHINVFHDVIKEVLSQMDLDTSLYFMEVFNSKMSKLKAPSAEQIVPTEMRLADAKILNEKIAQKLNDE